MKNIFVLYHGRFPGERAASLFVAKECEAFANQGLRVTLLVPRRLGREKTDPYTYYHVEKNFRIVYLPTLDLFPGFLPHAFNFALSLITFSFFSFYYLLFVAGRKDLIYSNEVLSLGLASLFFQHTLCAVHALPAKNSSFYKILFGRMSWILTTNSFMKNALQKDFGIDGKKIIHEPNAVDLKEFAVSISKEEARKKLNLPQDMFLAVYTGHLYGWKGVDTLAQAAQSLPLDVKVIFVGGAEPDIRVFKEKYSGSLQISIVGYRPHSEVPLWQKAADVLVLPNSAKEEVSQLYTSPMKLFEYMASSTPVVASDLPSIRELLTHSSATLVVADDVQELSKAILQVKENYKGALEKAKQAYSDVSVHTWDQRAKRVLQFCKID